MDTKTGVADLAAASKSRIAAVNVAWPIWAVACAASLARAREHDVRGGAQ